MSRLPELIDDHVRNVLVFIDSKNGQNIYLLDILCLYEIHKSAFKPFKILSAFISYHYKYILTLS